MRYKALEVSRHSDYRGEAWGSLPSPQGDNGATGERLNSAQIGQQRQWRDENWQALAGIV